MSKEDFEAAAHFFIFAKSQDCEIVVSRDILAYLGRPVAQLRSMTSLLVDNLPLISIRKGRCTILLDAPSYVKSGDRLSELINFIKSADKEENQKGSGKKVYRQKGLPIKM